MRHNGQMHVDTLVQETTEESRGTWAAAGNLTFGYQNNAILPPPLMTAGDDVSGVATPADVSTALDVLVTEQSALHLRAWERLASDAHRTLLALMARDPQVEPTASAMLRRWPLPPKSTVARIVTSLVDDEYVVRSADGSWRLDDPFFARWIVVSVG